MAGAPQVVKNNPNASLAGGLTFVGVGVAWLTGHFGWGLTGEEQVVLSGGITTGGLWIGRNGIRGIAKRIWKGNDG